ncbi:ribosome-associated translation inhibitor RaiA [Stappia sp. F7233]|uniref:Ribosome hibernation promoting factor n=1 Tax=Stappia albiluteola TaxID=2758565 RepID=A0A839AD20_9HYPH|nr:ribosome-associated translation inhibitor RaiA [Stappia albiluteola]MBA5777015.1 ribosome-associated translation inhibitor RaiA [Stappia albiluteola]
MTLRVSGKNVDVGDALRSHIVDRVDEALSKYFDGGYTGHVTIGREGSGFRTECALHLDTGIVLQVSADSHEPRPSFDAAADRIEKRLRRYKRKLKDHKTALNGRDTIEAASYILASTEGEEEVPADFTPVVVAETSAKVRTLTVGMAVMELDLAEAPVVVFRNAGNGAINVVYRRSDGNVGWIDPELAKNGEAK